MTEDHGMATRTEAISTAQRVLREETDPCDPFVVLSYEFLTALGEAVPGHWHDEIKRCE